MTSSWDWFAALLCLLCLGVEVHCTCTKTSIDIIGGNYTLTRNLEKDSRLVYHCSEGQYPYPELTRVCQADGTWKPAPKRSIPQTCKRVTCPDPFVLQNGNVSPPQDNYFVGDETTYMCDSGYTMRGSSSRICLPNGKWNGSTPICSYDSGEACPDPGIPPGASRTGNGFDIDDRVKYTCSDNMFLVGSSERVCQENGQWTGKEPACYYKHTYDTPQEVSEAFGSAIKDSLTTLESLNDTQEGRKIRISKAGILNIYIGVDISESILKEEFEQARNAVITLINKISRFSVSPNYEIIFFSSEVYEVVNILDFYDDNKEDKLKHVINDLKAFEIGDRNTGTDLNLAFKTFEDRMSFRKEQVGPEVFKEYRHTLIMFTDGVYNMGGPPTNTVERIKNIVYMNAAQGVKPGSREDFLDIYVFGIGAQIFDDDLQPLTVGKDGKHYFRMKDIGNLGETFDEIIDESEVVGMCGLYQEYDITEDKDSRLRRYPWVAFVINKGQNKKTCFGSLVSPDFVLTAAHCFTFGDEPKDVVVEIEDGSASRVKEVKNFTWHPNYNIRAKAKEGVAEFYDYDVAIIRLSEAVAISASTRPICIPCTQETSEALKLVGKSTCKQQEELLLKDKLERLSFLTKHEPFVAEKEVFAKLGEDRNLCIQKALNAPGISATDPKVAVTDNFLCTGGLDEQRNHISCRGDSGGAVFKNYELRTIQIGVVSWGTHDLCGSATGGLIESNEDSRDFHVNLFKMVDFFKSVLGDDNQDYVPLRFLEE
ncbi:complement factor B [Nothobranchius furzeri]|uniref:C3/C5 convertase n=1 Tax=Nothobranchius furzeri TaxID=105023 RepID=A0A9D2YW50_NOTFU|nr:complement factor B-like [Nothobranchius furzeri]